MKKRALNILHFAVLFLVLSCENKSNDFEYEKRVMTDIFPSLVDSICVDSRKMMPPPLLGEFITDKTGHVKIDSTKATNEQRVAYEKWKKEREKVEKDTSTVFIAFNPFLQKGSFRFDKELEIKYPILETSIFNDNVVKGYQFDYVQIKLNNKFKLKNISEFPEIENRNLLYEIKYDFVFSGILYVSRIQFDNKKKSGLLEASFSFCGKCGRGYNVFVKEIHNRWVIEKVEETWVS